ncbi:unnamed protein product [Rotaria sp. Silwood2]|nr:unnamed protein product [Rotaria sp. Silwood2]CAF4179808.1 unnamed protein product [Rotaria sp. Silwood2]
MAMDQFNRELLKLLSLGNDNQNSIIRRLDDLAKQFGTIMLGKWRNLSNNKNSLLHELVERKLDDVLHYAMGKYELDINVRRGSDGLTPFQLASVNNDQTMCNLLKQLGANAIQTEDVSKWSPDADREKSMNIVWIDLEMTSIEEPEILECAVIITDKDLQVLDREGLGKWHQETFANQSQGGNGLFADVLKSRLTKERVEDELLTKLKLYCPEKMCPLAGSSIHIDKQVLKLQMPKVHDYLHYRIIDVSSFQAIMRRWAPWIEGKIKKQLARNGQDTVNHRAMDDIEWSISFMKEFRVFLAKPNDVHNRKNEAPKNRRRNHSTSPSRSAQNYSVPRNRQADNKPQLYGDEKRLLERLKQEEQFDVESLKLNKKDRQIYEENPHLREVFRSREKLQLYQKDFTSEMRLLVAAPKEFDNKNADSRKINTTEHWGQRKLLLTEIEFLTNYGADGNYLVIYAGAAPGSHLNFLSLLFPKLEFVLIDTTEFDVKPTERVKIRSESFNSNLAQQFAGLQRDLLFICNVHTFNDYKNQQDDIIDDMENQKIWHRLLKPSMSLLNFRLPHKPGATEYLKGTLVIEPWASKRSSECRLIVKKDATVAKYDNALFEEDLSYFHNVTRIMHYEHNIEYDKGQGLDHCYDCRAEIFILQQYLSKVQKITKESDLVIKTVELSSNISRNIVNKKREQVLGIARALDSIKKNGMGASNEQKYNF